MSDESEVLCERQGVAGLITLNRPRALNALTLGMVRIMRRALDAWADDPGVTRVVVTGAGGRAFCAGGDVRTLCDLCRAGRHQEALQFWREEYALNLRIKSYPKPYVCLLDGIVMGGGIGISTHGSHRVAGDHAVFAMPEVSIGFFPDVGATYALPRLPGRSGLYLALTGNSVAVDEGLALGLATHAVPSAALPEVRDRLVAGEDVDLVLARLAAPAGTPLLAAQRGLIDACFSAPGVPAILAALESAARDGSEFAGETFATISTKSPTSLTIAFEQMRRGAMLDLKEAMRTEFRIVSRIIHGHDFFEGVRAMLVDKDRAPRWEPGTLAAVDPAEVERHFDGLGADEFEAV